MAKLLRPQRLKGVHPLLRQIVRESAAEAPWNLLVLEGVRTIERQKILVARGSSWTMNSRHLKSQNGYGHAVDLAPVFDTDGDGDVEASWNWADYDLLGPLLKSVGRRHGVRLVWGGDWKRRDGPHIQLPWSYK